MTADASRSYRYAYQMVLHKQGTQLFNGVRNLVAEHLDVEATQKIAPTFPSPSTSVLATAPTGVSAASPDGPSSPRALHASPSGSLDKGKGKARADGVPHVGSGQASSTAVGGAATDRLARVQAGERFLKSVRDVWDGHVACMKKLRDVLKYMVGPLSRSETAKLSLRPRW